MQRLQTNVTAGQASAREEAPALASLSARTSTSSTAPLPPPASLPAPRTEGAAIERKTASARAHSTADNLLSPTGSSAMAATPELAPSPHAHSALAASTAEPTSAFAARADARIEAGPRDLLGLPGTPLPATASSQAPLAPSLPTALSPTMTEPTTASALMASRPGQPEFGRELGAQVTVWAREGLQQAQLHLHPSELGPIQVHIQVQGQEAQLQFVADHAQTREALQNSLGDLVAALQQEGLNLGHSDIQGQSGSQEGRGGRASDDPAQAPGARRFGLQSGPLGSHAGESALPMRPAARGLLDLYA